MRSTIIDQPSPLYQRSWVWVATPSASLLPCKISGSAPAWYCTASRLQKILLWLVDRLITKTPEIRLPLYNSRLKLSFTIKGVHSRVFSLRNSKARVSCIHWWLHDAECRCRNYHCTIFPMHTIQILPACEEMLAAVTKFAELAYEHGRNCLSRPWVFNIYAYYFCVINILCHCVMVTFLYNEKFDHIPSI